VGSSHTLVCDSVKKTGECLVVSNPSHRATSDENDDY
jgi:hypothetical protein